MAIRKKTSTTRLPQSLQQQLDEAASTSTSAYDQNHHSRNQNGRKSYFSAASRKDARKQERLARKQNKAVYFSSSHISNARKRGAEEELVESTQPKKLKSHESDVTTVPPKVAKSLLPVQSVVQDITCATTPKSTDASPSIKVSKQPTKATKGSAHEISKKKSSTVKLKPSPKEDKEDAYIAYLESKLGIDKGGNKKGKKVAEEEDGLDDLMAWADSFVAPITESEEDGEDEDAESLRSEDVSESESSGNYDDEEWHGIGESVENSNSEPKEEADTPHSATSSAYVPPHLRNAQRRDDSNSEAILKLTRQLKGLLNRMGEQNIGTILDSVEAVYRSHRRNDVTSILTTLIIDGISSHSSLLDSYVVLYAAFVSSLHKIVGVEFAAHLVQTLVASYERHYASIQDTTMSSTDNATEQDGKECSNLVVLISELYNFQVVSSVLVFDVIRRLLSDDLTEFKVELLLKILRNSGQQLRQDDPSALKDIIEIVQRKVSVKDDGVNSRTRFMVETLINLKNNKSKRNVTQNQGGAAVERMKKFLSGLSKTRHVLAHEPLRVSLEDLHLAESKGKWWLVGAAWGGDPLVDKQAEFTKTTGVSSSNEEMTADEDSDLVKLARSQGMNTEIRRGIFVVLMSSDDYVDACERLSQLSLTEVQQREIIRVLLHCCGNERLYNPYYSLVGQQLSRTAHAYKITLQFTLWDFLRDLGESNVGGAAVIKNAKEDVEFDVKSISKTRIQHVAKAYAWWIAKDCANLMILKPVDFTRLKTQTRDFFKELFIQIFVNSQQSTPLANSNIKDLVFTRNRNAVEEIFIKVSRVEALAMGLVFYFSDSFSEKHFKSDDGFSKFLKWAVGVAEDTLRTGIDLVPSTVQEFI